ncbi:MAG: hypothetical protein AAF449_00450 [Myxococcota bacterium]
MILLTSFGFIGFGLCPRLALSQSKAPNGFEVRSKTWIGDRPARTGRVRYGHHHLRIDQGNETTAIVDLHSGSFTMVMHARKAYTSVSIAQMKAQRAASRTRALAEIERMPPKTRDMLVAQMKAQDAAMTRTANVEVGTQTRKILGQACRQTTWTSPQGRGSACLHMTPPIDTSAFQADARIFERRLRASGIGTGALALPLLMLGPHGFAVRTEEESPFGPTQVKTKTDYYDGKAKYFSEETFRPPRGYQKLSVDQLMLESSSPSGS